MPVFDETGIPGTFDFELPMSILDPESSWSDEALEDLGLKVTHEEREADVLFVTPAK